MTETHGMSRSAKVALLMNVCGTLLMVASMFINHPLIFMVVVVLGVALLAGAFLIWLRMAVRRGLGIHPASGPPVSGRPPS